MRRTTPMTLLIGSLALFISGRSLAGENSALENARATITTDELKAHIDVLADDSFEGREAGSRGGRAAGGYLAKQFQTNGTEAAGTNGFYQPFGANYRNILGVVHGSDPELKGQVIVVGAHYDHVGYGTWSNSYGPTGYIHNGADDNASGTAGLLEVMDAMRSLPDPPARTILFALWDGEEKGLLGSKYWLANPTVELGQVVLMINMDMIGRLRNGKLEVYGTRTASGLRRIVSAENQDLGLDLDFTWEMKANSDHHPFFARGIPAMMLHTGLHNDYHRPSDDAEKVNAEGIKQVSGLLLNVVHATANRAELPSFRTASRLEGPMRQRALERALPPIPPRIGISWKREDAQPGLELTRVIAGGPAARAGLKVGDRLLELGGVPLDDEPWFRRQILTAAEPIVLRVQPAGVEGFQDVTVELDGKPVRIGISWREDKGDAGSLVISRIVPGSPAQAAGMRVGDRIYAVAGERLTGTDQFLANVNSGAATLDLKLEHRGRLRGVTLELE